MTLSAPKTWMWRIACLMVAALVFSGSDVLVRGQSRPATASTIRATKAQLERQVAFYKSRVQQDRRRFSKDAVADADAAYKDLAGRKWRGDEARTLLRTMIERFPEFNRTGCAVLNYAAAAEGDEAEQYLKRAAERHSDSFYPDGAQVGALAKYHLAHRYRAAGKTAEAEKLFEDIRTNYPDAIAHNGELLVAVVNAEGSSGKQSLPATQPAE